jgi:hypothetical protein
VTFAPGITTLKWVFIRSCALTGSTLASAILANNASLQGLDLSFNVLNWTKSIGNSDIASTLEYLYLENCKITGDVAITASRPNLKEIKLGTANNANNNFHNTIDLTGCTGLRAFTFSGGSVAAQNYSITLPTSSVMNTITLTGVKTTLLDMPSYTTATNLVIYQCELNETNNPNLISRINGCTAVGNLELRLLSGTPAFTNPNLSSMAALSVARLEGANLIGTLTLHNHTMSLLNVGTNPLLTAISGLGAAVNQFWVDGCTLLNFDYSYLTSFTSLTMVATANTLLDMTGRTTTSFGSIGVQNMASLTEIRFPTATNAGRLSSIGISGCPVLVTLANTSNIDMNTTGACVFSLWSCNTFNSTVLIGVNNFTPRQVNMFSNPAWSQANLDATIGSLYTNRAKTYGTSGAKTWIISGTTVAPGGTYAAPVGFSLGVSDGTPVSAKEQIYVLVNNYGWTFTFN